MKTPTSPRRDLRPTQLPAPMHAALANWGADAEDYFLERAGLLLASGDYTPAAADAEAFHQTYDMLWRGFAPAAELTPALC